ncbi:MAG: APC family permease [Fervidicoccaceae archaeon]
MAGKIDFTEALMIGIGGMFGLAIFVFPGTTGKMIGGWDVIAWPLTGLLMISVGLIYSELSSAYKVSGGPVLYIRLVLGKSILSDMLSFISTAGFYIGWTIAIVIGAITAPQYLAYAFPFIIPLLPVLPPLLVVITYIISISGFKRATRTNYILTLSLLVVVVIYSASILSKGDFSKIFISPEAKLSPFLSSIGIIIGAYGAWVGIPTLYNQIKQPDKNVPKAVSLSLVFTAAIYTILVLALHSVVPYESFLSVPEAQISPFSYALELVGGSYYFKIIFSLAVFLAIFTTMLVGMLSLGTSIFMASEYGLISKKLAYLDKKIGGSNPISTLVSAIPSIILSIYPQYFFSLMVIGLVIGTDLPYIINLGSYVIYKMRENDLESPFRVPFGLLVGVVAFSLIVISTVNLSLYELEWSLMAIAIILLVFVFLKFLEYINPNRVKDDVGGEQKA